ncbi:MAG: hypothetical protein KY410_06135, partial [Proteobacteria bacterium]|nr:hypothetical protein [Pseudomonadota bacterium]
MTTSALDYTHDIATPRRVPLFQDLAVSLALLLALAAAVLPVAADDEDDDEASIEAGPLEVEGRPAIVAPTA